MRVAGYLHGDLEHHLDHLAPLCAVMEWPLIVTDERIYDLGRCYYPDLIIEWVDPVSAPFDVTHRFDAVVTTVPRIGFDELFFVAEMSLGKRLATLWLPHGNSDKGYSLCWKGLLFQEETVLVYGEKMRRQFLELNMVVPDQCLVDIGNFRRLYFLQHQQFYESLMDQRGISNQFAFYAPTWNDAEGSSSLMHVIDTLLETPLQIPVVIKPHPNQARDIEVLQKQLSSPSSLTWLHDFPPIYPLLSRTLLLMGDFSSVGYDFLAFNRPMVFFRETSRDERGCALHKVGTVVSLRDLPEILGRLPNYTEPSEKQALRDEVYRSTFARHGTLEAIKSLLWDRVKRLDS